jgi:hypothetical protein
MRCPHFFGLILAGLCSTVLALYESDVGIVDWHLPLVGVPLTSSLNTAPAFHAIPKRPPTEALLLTATSSNVLAALRASNGQLGAFQPHHGPYCHLTLVQHGGSFLPPQTTLYIINSIEIVCHLFCASSLTHSRSGCVFIRTWWLNTKNVRLFDGTTHPGKAIARTPYRPS